MRHLKRRAVTLIEVVVSVLLISTLMLVSLQASATVAGQRARNNETRIATELIDAFFNEISAVDFQDQQEPLFGLEPDENTGDRQTYDDVDDYHLFTAQPPTDRGGNVLTSSSGQPYSQWSISVQVLPAGLDGTPLPVEDADSAPLRSVALTCVSGTGVSYVERWVTSGVPTSPTADVTDNQERLRQVSIGFADGRRATIVTPLRNRPVTREAATGG